MDESGAPKKQSSMLRAALPALGLLGIGWYFALSIAGGAGAGLLVDGWLDTRPLFAVIGLALGLLVAVWGGYRLLKRAISTRNQE